ncbi:Ig-like domain-containing protein, partial [Diaphorobacter ruginosibacter]|uniref:Ig-like domain-containing protein n=1 Tax=Diaphorobacter ruginosibacter TaxID=1715720 RepID=UPI003340BD28
MSASVGPVEIVVVSKKTAVSKYGMPADFRLDDASVVQIKTTRAEVKEMVRIGDDLVVKLHNGESVTVRGFFAQLDGGQNNLVLQDDMEGLWLLEFGSGEGSLPFGYSNLYSIDPLLVGEEQTGGVLPVVLGWAGGMAALLGMTNSHGGKDEPIHPAAAAVDPVNGIDPITGTAEPGTTVVVTFPNGTTATAVVGADGKFSVPNPGLNDGDQVSVVVTNSDGGASDPTVVTVDAIAPDAPHVNPTNGSDPITGTAEPGSTVTLTFPDGSKVTVVADENGNFSVAPPEALADGDIVTVTATDAAGNVSEEAVLEVDAVAPESPVVDPINAHDPITGNAEPGSTVTITYPDGSTDSQVVGEDGKFEFENPGLKDGDTVTVVATDPSGNTSGEAEATVDAVAPAAPIVDPVNAHDPITGKAEPGSTVTITYPDGSTDSVVVGKDGKFEFQNPGLEDSDVLKLVATDPAGNTSDDTRVVVDAVAPLAPSVDPVNGHDPITGEAEPGTTVKITYPDGSTDSVTVGKDGKFEFKNPGLEDGDTVKVNATDPAGNTSNDASATVDAASPDAPIVDPINANDPITGEAEPGSTVTVTYPDGSTDSVT